MAFTPSLIGRTTFSAVTSATLATGNISIGTKILMAVCLAEPDWDDITDTQSNSGFDGNPPSGNVYGQKSGEAHPNGTCGVWFIVGNALTVALRGGGTRDNFVLSRAAGMTGQMAAFSVTGLASGVMDGGSALFGTDMHPNNAVDAVANDYVVGIVGVAGPSTDGFTQDATFTNPGNFNTQNTPAFSVYSGFRQSVAGGHVLWQPTLGVSRDYVSLLLALKP